MSRNMELVDILPFRHSSEDQFEVTHVDYTASSTDYRKHLIVTAHQTQDGYALGEPYEKRVCLRIADVTNPRAAKSDYLRIYVRGRTSLESEEQVDAPLGNFGILQVYRDEQEPEAETFNGDVFVIAWTGGSYGDNIEGGLPLEPDHSDSTNDLKARFVIINLTRAIKMCESQNPGSTGHVIEIKDASVRNVAYGHNGSAPTNQSDGNVYVGYVKSDYEWLIRANGSPADRRRQQNPHALNIDQQAGIMTLSPHEVYSITHLSGSDERQPFFDAFDVSELGTTMTWASTATQAPDELNRLTMDVTINSNVETVPLMYPAFTLNSEDFRAGSRDVHIEKISSTKARLVMASPTGQKKRRDHDPMFRAGGVITMTVSYATPSNCVIDDEHWWDYDIDRTDVGARHSGEDTWWFRTCHTASVFRHTNTTDVLMLTSDELASPHFNPVTIGLDEFGQSLASGETDAVPLKIESIGSTPGYTGGRWRAFLNATDPADVSGIEDDRRIGAFTRVWKTTLSGDDLHPAARGGTGATGPQLIYDSPEALDRDDLYYSSVRDIGIADRIIATTAIAQVNSNPGNAAELSNDNKIAPSTTHRSHVIPPYDARYASNANDVLLSSYAQGVRIINLTDALATSPAVPVVHEKAFFDFIPTLSYNAWDPYFYKLAHRNNAAYKTYNTMGETPGNYFLGAWHSVMDFGPQRATTGGIFDDGATPQVRLPADEKFVYMMGFGEGRLSAEVARGNTIALEDPVEVGDGRNWLHDGGFLVLRYYDGKLGGTIAGYTGTNSFDNRTYQTLNLQGPFDVERDVTIATGMCVFALPGHASDPGIFTETSFSRPGGQTIYVDGLLFLSVDGGDPNGTDITVDVPIVVRPGGKLIMNPIAAGKRIIIKRPIVVEPDGEWTINAGAHVELRAEQHTCNGRFEVRGTTESRVTITSNQPSSGPYAYTSQASVRRTGGGTLNASIFRMHYCDSKNVGYSFADMNTSDIDSVTNSTFVRTEGGAGLTTLSFLSFSDRVTQPQNHFLFVNQCAFSDEAVSFPSAMITNGITVGRAKNLEISSSAFENLKAAIVPVAVGHVYIRSCSVSQCTLGVNTDANKFVMCQTELENNMFSSSMYGVGTAQHLSNGIGNTSFGIRSSAGGVNRYWRNEFDWYGRGIFAVGAGSHWLRDYVFSMNDIGGNPVEFLVVGGRNDFATSGTRPTVWPAPMQFIDIDLVAAGGIPELEVECGYNDFTEYSLYHAASNVPVPPLAATRNMWAPDPFEPRLNVNMAWTGTDLDQEQDPDQACWPNGDIDLNCEPPVDPLSWVGDHDDDDPPSSAQVHHAVHLGRTAMADTTLSDANRRMGAWAATMALVQSDSVPLYTTVRGELESMAADTSLATYVRSSALMLRAKTFVKRNSLDTAKAIYQNVVANYSSQADSLNAVWSIMALNAIMDTTGVRDSLFGFYIDRVIADLTTASADTSAMEKSLGWFVQEGEAGEEMAIIGVAPNPSGGGYLNVDIHSVKASVMQWQLVAISGATVAEGTTTVAQGTSAATLEIPSLPTGSYILRCQAGGTAKAMRITIQP